MDDKETARIREKIGDLSTGFAKDMTPPEIAGGEGHSMANVRRFLHKGRECVIETHYKILVDGEPLAGHLSVDERGGVHHHGLPNYSFSSAVDLVRTVLDASKYDIDDEDKLAYIYEEREV